MQFQDFKSGIWFRNTTGLDQEINWYGFKVSINYEMHIYTIINYYARIRIVLFFKTHGISGINNALNENK